MKFKTSYYYQLSEHRNAIAVFYAIIILVMFALLYFSTYIFAQSEGGIFSGFDGSSIIFLFIAGLCGFKCEFLFLMQNGISRKTILLSRIFTAITVSVFMVLVDKILYVIAGGISSWSDNGLQIVSLTEQLFHTRFSDMHLLYDFMLTFFIYLSVISIGYVIATSNYRLSGIGKKFLCVGAIGVFLSISVLDTVFLQNNILSGLIRFVDFAYGITAMSPINAIITSMLIFVLCSIVSYVLIRRVPVKE